MKAFGIFFGGRFGGASLLSSILAVSSVAIGVSAESTGVEADMSLGKLTNGNAAYVSGTLSHRDQTGARRTDVAKGQHPFAVVVSCSDSRVPPEVIFDQGIGDLFVIRTAGEVVTDVALGSIEYGVEHLGAPLILVLAHERCGAVQATVAGGEPEGNIKAIVDLIKPAVEKAKQQSGDVLDNAIKINADLVAEKIASSPVIKKLIEEKKVKIVKAYYDLDDGTVRILP